LELVSLRICRPCVKLLRLTTTATLGPAHAVYFATYEAVKHIMGGNKAGVHHPLAAATSGACATIASDALMNPFDGMAALSEPRVCAPSG
jgi:hypothetical protein